MTSEIMKKIRNASLLLLIAFIPLAGLSGCASQDDTEQMTVFIAQKTPDDLHSILATKPLPVGRITVLGGQIIRRTDSPVGAIFLIRALPLTEDSFPKQLSDKEKRKDITSRDTFILFVPSLKMIGQAKPKINPERSGLIVFGNNQNQTPSIGTGNLITAVGEIKGMERFPQELPVSMAGRHLLMVSHYVMLWSSANKKVYPPLLKH
ncbi:hypothetical protein [Leptospirillum ferrooxidans]|nr:hypothetical protein [Leptospirillum ferrooxidans]